MESILQIQRRILGDNKMLESVFLMLMAAGFIFFILAVEKESVLYSSVSLLMWIITLAGQLYVEVPSDTYYNEPSLVPVSLAFIFINVLWSIIIFFDFKSWKNSKIKP